jgi:hypothetical protein
VQIYKLSLFIPTLIILGCAQAQSYKWVKPGASDQEYYKSSSYCDALATGSTPMDYSSEDGSTTYHYGTIRDSGGRHGNYYGISTTYNNNTDQELNNLSQSIKREKIFNDCMRGNGWLLQEVSQIKKAKLTKEQSINQLKYMMSNGFALMEKELIETGGFSPFGMVLFPDGEFKPLTMDWDPVSTSLNQQLDGLAINLEKVAKTREVWGVGLIYLVPLILDDGSYEPRIVVLAEHIAGWARHWVFPFKVENSKVLLGQSEEGELEPVYFPSK